MPCPPVTRDAITAALKEWGPMSVPELMEELGWSRNRVNTCLTTARANHPGKFFRIVAYRKQVGVQGRETPIYSATPGKDLARPEFGAAHVTARNKAYYQSNRAKFAISNSRRRASDGAAGPWSGLQQMATRSTRNQPATHAVAFLRTEQ